MFRYTLRQLDYLVACAEAGSVVAAAARLNVSQPSVSAALSKLEADLGVQLLLRQHAQGVVPTPDGAPLIQAARNLLLQAREFQQAAALASEEIAGVLQIGSFHSLAPVYLPALYAALAEAHPRIELRVREASQDDLVRDLRQGQIHAALLYDLDLPEDVATVPLAAFQPRILLPADHPLARRRRIALADLAAEPLILLDIPPSRDYFTGLLRAAGLTPRIAFRSASLELVRGMVGRGLGYSLLVTRPPGDTTYDGQPLAIRPLAEEVSPSPVVLGRLASLHPTRALAAFEAVTRDYFRGAGEVTLRSKDR